MFLQNSIPNYEIPFGSDHHKGNNRSTEVTPYSVPQDIVRKSHSKVANNGYEPLPNPAEYLSAIGAYSNIMSKSITDDDIRALDYSEISTVDSTATNDDKEVYSDPGHSEAAVYDCFEKKKIRKIEANDVRY